MTVILSQPIVPGIHGQSAAVPSAPVEYSSDQRPRPQEFIGNGINNLPTSTDPSSYPVWVTDVDYHPNAPNLSPCLHRSSISNRMGDADAAMCMDAEKFHKGSLRKFSIRKVFCILLIQFVIISMIVGLFFAHLNIVGVNNNYNLTILTNTRPSFWYMVVAGLVAIISTILSYVRDWPSQKSPQNIFLLGILTISYILFGGTLVVFFEVESMLWMTVPVLLAFVVFSLQSSCR